LAQDTIVEIEPAVTDSPLVVCEGCGKLVPKTNLCLYCGSPILYRLKARMIPDAEGLLKRRGIE
jgi:rRNA maturation endonuclease Nob1